jgi:hypothetical protein
MFSGRREMKLEEEWKTYRTRFLVHAKQLPSSLSFVDHLGRQHRGRKGDYLVESSDGVISIAPRRIFEDIYVPMSVSSASSIEAPEAHIDVPKFPAAKFDGLNSTVHRKLPQPCRDRRDPPPNPSARFM